MIRLLHQRWFERALRTRIPFRYGIATMTEVPHVWLEVEAEIDGERVRGWAADHLPPKWFTKDPARSLPDEISDMRAVLRAAGTHAVRANGPTIDAIMAAVGEAQRVWAKAAGHPPLLANFGVTFIERALIDALCRRHRLTLHAALVRNAVGVDLGRWHDVLGGTTPSQGLPPAALGLAWARHTVGLGDPLEDAEVAEEGRPSDELPVSLSAVIRRYGQRHFKIKIAAGEADAVTRLAATVTVIARETGGRFSASLDGNETFANVAALQEFWARARAEPALAVLWPNVLFLEQPIARSVALSEAVGEGLRAWPERPPLLIDESGADPGDTRMALDLGYAGVSHKNCKGVLQGVANACLLAQRRTTEPGRAFIMSGEDLANVGPLALPQDLAVQAALGNTSIERNGHHYFAGLSEWSSATCDYACGAYPDLYRAGSAGWPTLRIGHGQLQLASVNRQAFGGEREPLMAPAGVPWFEA